MWFPNEPVPGGGVRRPRCDEPVKWDDADCKDCVVSVNNNEELCSRQFADYAAWMLHYN